MNINMPRAEADAHRARLLAVATQASGAESAAAWIELREFNAARRVAAQHGQLYERQRQGLVGLGRASTANAA